MGARMILLKSVMSALLLSMCTLLHAEDGQTSLLDLEFRQQRLQGVDGALTHREYEQLYSRNQRYMRRTLKSYAEQALNRMGVSGMAVGVAGAAVGVVSSGGARLNLNETKTLGIEVRNLDGEAPGLYFGFDLEW